VHCGKAYLFKNPRANSKVLSQIYRNKPIFDFSSSMCLLCKDCIQDNTKNYLEKV